jgi:hypothetical protein
VSSRDGSDQSGWTRRSAPSDRGANPRKQTQRTNQPSWDIDPAEIDRYLSGRPSREQETKVTARSRTRQDASQGTAGQLNRLQRAVSDRRASHNERSQRISGAASPGRQEFAEPDYDIDEVYAENSETAPEYRDDESYEEMPTPPSPRRNRTPGQVQRQARTSAAQSPRQRQQTPRRRQPVRDEYDDPTDDELYADDPYLTYDDERDWEVPARRRTARTRPKVKFTTSSLPKVSMPRSISGAELVNDIPSLALIGAAILSAAIMAIVVSNRLDLLPLTIPTHVSASGLPENIRGRNALWSVPLLSIALSLMNIVTAWFLAKADMFAARFVLAAALLVQFIAWIALIRYLW